MSDAAISERNNDFARAVLRRFRLGQDTWQIAKVFQSANIGGRDRVDEAAVARALAQAREAERMKRVSDQNEKRASAD